MGRQLGVIFGPVGGQDRPSSVQNASWKRIFIKNVNFHQTLRLPIPQRFLEPQDASQNAPRSVQDGPKRLLESNFFALENRLKFCLVLAPILVDLGRPKCSQIGWMILRGEVWKLIFFCMSALWCFGHLQGGLQRVQEAPKRPQEAPKSTPRGPQERPRRLQEGLNRPQEPVKRAQDPPKSSQEPPKTPTRLFRSTWLGSRFRKIQKIQSMAPKGIDDA